MATYKPAFRNTEPTQFVLDEYTCGFAQCVDNNWNYAIYAQNPDVSIYQNEYNAGYVQGKVQTGATILATRNNSWRNFLIGATPQNALSIEVKPEYLTVSAKVLVENYNYLYQWVSARSSDDKVQKIIRLMFRQLGIYDGAAGNAPRTGVELADLQLSGLFGKADQIEQFIHRLPSPFPFLHRRSRGWPCPARARARGTCAPA